MKNKGISLIVLIITIVVIIILAAAIILNLSNTNVIENANEAVEKQTFATLQEELNLYIADKYLQNTGKFDAVNLNADTKEKVLEILPSLKNSKYEDEITIANGEIVLGNGIDVEIKEMVRGIITTSTKTNKTINGGEFAYNNPVIPVGFKTVETSKATWKDNDKDGKPDGWNNGLVIADSNNNEYVWIPVDGINVTYAKWNSSKNTDWSVTKEQVEDDTLPTGIISETSQITKYGGFYVARYEAGLPDNQTKAELMATKTFSRIDNNRTDIGKAQSKAGKIVWNRIDYNNAKILSENVVSTNYVQSGLITGTQWDTMLDFLSQEVNVDTYCIDWGNYYNKYGYTINGYYRAEHADSIYIKGEYTKTENSYLLLQTGKFGSVVAEGSPKNLFDVAGNVWEWSAETVIEQGGKYTAVGYKLLRGGSYSGGGSNYVTSYRVGNDDATSTFPDVGFRFVLYIK